MIEGMHDRRPLTRCPSSCIFLLLALGQEMCTDLVNSPIAARMFIHVSSRLDTVPHHCAGLSANTTFDETDLEAQLTKERAQSVEFAPEETTEITKQLFQDGLGQVNAPAAPALQCLSIF